MEHILGRWLEIAKTLKSVTKAEMAYGEIRNMIADGRLAPGEAVVHRVFAERLSISNAPVIEALRRLEADGFLERRPHRHARVKEWNVTDHIERLIMREALEGLAARWCATRITDEQVTELGELVERIDSFADVEKDGVVHADLDTRFHLLIARYSGLQLVAKELQQFDLFNRTMISGSLCPVRRGLDARSDHDRIVAALAKRDPDGAEKAMREHLREAREWYINVARDLKLLDEGDFANSPDSV